MPADPETDLPLRSDLSHKLLLGRFYTVTEMREPQRGVRLVCLQNPWTEGGWGGAWSAESTEWANNPEVAAKLWLP